MNRIAVIALGIVAVGSAAALYNPNPWKGFVYPNKDDLTHHLEIGPYPNLEACRAAAQHALSTTFTPPGDYECGKNCRPQPGPDAPQICDVTER